MIESVNTGGAAEKAGLKAGDVIVKVNGQEMKNAKQVSSIARDTKPGDKVKIELLGGKTVEVTMG